LEPTYGRCVECRIPPLPYGQGKLQQAIDQNVDGAGRALLWPDGCRTLFRWAIAQSPDGAGGSCGRVSAVLERVRGNCGAISPGRAAGEERSSRLLAAE